MAVDEGLFAEKDLDITLRHHGAQEDLFTALLSGQEDLVLASSDEAVVAAAGGAELQTFATFYQEYPVVILTADPAITDLNQLAGQRVGLPGRFGSNYYGFLAALSQAGMSEDDVEVVEIGFTQVTALTTDKVDAIVAFRNNEAVQLRDLGFEFAQLEVQSSSEPSLYGPGLIIKSGGIETATLGAIAEAVHKAQGLIYDDPELALSATEQHVPSLSDPVQRANAHSVLEASIDMWLRDGKPSLHVSETGFERMAKFLREVGITNSVPTDIVARTA